MSDGDPRVDVGTSIQTTESPLQKMEDRGRHQQSFLSTQPMNWFSADYLMGGVNTQKEYGR